MESGESDDRTNIRLDRQSSVERHTIPGLPHAWLLLHLVRSYLENLHDACAPHSFPFCVQILHVRNEMVDDSSYWRAGAQKTGKKSTPRT